MSNSNLPYVVNPTVELHVRRWSWNAKRLEGQVVLGARSRSRTPFNMGGDGVMKGVPEMPFKLLKRSLGFVIRRALTDGMMGMVDTVG